VKLFPVSNFLENTGWKHESQVMKLNGFLQWAHFQVTPSYLLSGG
jgi:hypothetical protein